MNEMNAAPREMQRYWKPTKQWVRASFSEYWRNTAHGWCAAVRIGGVKLRHVSGRGYEFKEE